MKRKIIRWYKKWIKGECRHICRLCKHKTKCWLEFPTVNVTITRDELREAFTSKQKLNCLYGIIVTRMMEESEDSTNETNSLGT